MSRRPLAIRLVLAILIAGAGPLSCGACTPVERPAVTAADVERAAELAYTAGCEALAAADAATVVWIRLRDAQGLGLEREEKAVAALEDARDALERAREALAAERDATAALRRAVVRLRTVVTLLGPDAPARLGALLDVATALLGEAAP